ncbi:InlB B-repeat-containing protein [Slackia piriformis]|nr:InlB B-repeat-containing protein [Slackia piriformis]
MTKSAVRTNHLRACALVFAAVLACALCGFGAWAHGTALADDGIDPLWTEDSSFGGKSVYLDPNDSYDVGSTGHINTHVYIEEPGTYTLRGSSKRTCVFIRSGGVTVYLENGLNIDPGAAANGGQSASAIYVETEEGDVTFVSKENATIKLSGYWGMPSILKQKEGSRIIFKTENEQKPGHIICDRSSYKTGNAVGIGIQQWNSPTPTANLRFESGKVTAKGAGTAAGIGTAAGRFEEGRAVSNIVITGTAEVVATGGSGGGPGIGSTNGDTTNITIGGSAKVTATGTKGSPGIGSGCSENDCIGKRVSVTIEGGTVTAKGGSNAPGIGSRGATVDAVTISGGTVSARGDGNNPAIGSGESCIGTTRINVSGGIVTSLSPSEHRPGLGTTKSSGAVDIRISGGTVDMYPGIIGVPKNNENVYAGSQVVITGGTIRTGSLAIYPAPVNSNNDRVYAATVSLENTSSGSVPSLTVGGVGYTYGVNDLQLRGGHLYLWLPNGGFANAATHESGACFEGSVIVGNDTATQGTLYLGNNVILDGGSVEETVGSARVSRQATRLTNVSAPTAQDGYVYISYRSADKLIPVADAASNQIVTGDDRYVDRATGMWIYEGDYPVTLSASWRAVTYGIRFDANVPDSASTEARGSMAEMKNLTFGEKYTLPENGFVLPGYRFVGWNTEPDGDGWGSFGDEGTINGENIVEGSSSGPYTLYAQWEPLSYEVTFVPGEGATGESQTQTLCFDEEEPLDPNDFTRVEYAFAGWRAEGGTVYADGAMVENLCKIEDDGSIEGFTLTAQWTIDDSVTIVITKDDKPDVFEPQAIKLVSTDDASSRFGDFEMQDDGMYSCKNIPPGTYGISIIAGSQIYSTDGVTVTVKAGAHPVVSLAYYTVSAVSKETDCVTAHLDGATEHDVEGVHTETLTVLKGTRVSLSTEEQTGYVFDGYTCVGVAPSDLVASKAESQQITINGAVEITPHTRSAVYKVEFVSNVPDDASGSVYGKMEPMAIAYMQELPLSENAYRLNGYTFAGWNTASDGSGSSYADGASVSNLATEDGATVTLYAQWKANACTVRFDGNKPAQASTDLTGSMADMHLTYDGTKRQLAPNGFSLPGYEFAGWNTASDGSGSPYADGASVSNLATEDGATVTLYAQWRPLTYTISFEKSADSVTASSITGSMDCLEVAFDETVQLPGCGFVYEGHVFSHWSTGALGSFYGDGASVKNLCGMPGTDGKLSSVTLSANWVEVGETAIVVRLDGAPASDLGADDVSLKPLDAETLYRGTSRGDGRFVFSDLPEGDSESDVYVVVIDGYDTGDLVVRRGETVTLDFYSVTITEGEHIASVWLSDPDKPATTIPHVLAGTIVSVGATADVGYVFDCYAATGTDPTWDPTVAEQGIVVESAIDITAHARPAAYTVRFSANIPDTASTASQATGSMADQEMVYDVASNLSANAFALPGYEFAGWNTKADGTGGSYADVGSVSNLATEDGATVTLYAQWEPLTYTITYVPGKGFPDAGGQLATSEATFDTSTKLASIADLGFTPPSGESFAGWSTGALGHYYVDGEAVVNLCSLDESGDPQGLALIAQWADVSVTTVVVTDDDVPSTRFGKADVELRAQDGTRYTAASASDGVFTFGDGASSLPDESFTIVVDGVDTGVEVSRGGTAKVAFCTVEVEAESGANVRLFDSDGTKLGSPSFVLEGARVKIEATVDEGFEFESYTAIGTQPAWEDNDPTKASQEITVNGKTLIEAHAFRIIYTVAFGANGGTGTMEKQDMVYGEPQNLFANAFTRAGYTFAGWNTAADGSGTGYADGERVSNLIAVNDATVTLYAQWSLIPPPAPSTNAVDREVAGHGTVTVDPERASAGDTVTVTSQPDDGYGLFAIEVVDSAGNVVALTDNEDGTYTFEMPASSVTVKATFKVILPFLDLDWSHWGYDDIALAYERGLMNGYGDGTFGADDVTTRGMAATVIWRLAGSPQATSDMPFSDVGDGVWYTEAIRWAAEAGVANGYGGTDLFGPEDDLTREQIVVLLMRYAETQGMDTSARADLSAFPDGDATSVWARDAVEWAVAVGLLRGDSNTGELDPQGGGSRAALAALVMRYDTMLPVGM